MTMNVLETPWQCFWAAAAQLHVPRSLTNLRLVLTEAGLKTTWPDELVGTGSVESALISKDIDNAVARLKSFKGWPDDWDGEGAIAPRDEVLDAAMAFLGDLHPWHPRPAATLDHKGHPVVEFPEEETGGFAHVRFLTSDTVELYAINSKGIPASCEGHLYSGEVLRFLSNEMQITLRRDQR